MSPLQWPEISHSFRGSSPTNDGHTYVWCSCGWAIVFDRNDKYPFSWDIWNAHKLGLLLDTDLVINKYSTMDSAFDPEEEEKPKQTHRFAGSGPVNDGTLWAYCSCSWKKQIRKLDHAYESWRGHAGNYGRLRPEPKIKAPKGNKLFKRHHWQAQPEEVSELAHEVLGGDYWSSNQENNNQEDQPVEPTPPPPLAPRPKRTAPRNTSGII